MASFDQLFQKFVEIVINPAIAVIFALGFLFFLFGIVEFLWNLQKGGPKEAGKRHMIWGVIGITIMVSVYGILNLLMGTFGVGYSDLTDTSRINNFQNTQFK